MHFNFPVIKIKFISVLILLLTARLTNAHTSISGEVSGTWTVNSTYYVTGDIWISAGKTLIIEPGVDVFFVGTYSFWINGLLKANGTSNNMISFRGNGYPGSWKAIYFSETASSECMLDYCLIKDGGYEYNSNIFIINNQKNVTISNCDICNSIGHGIYIQAYHVANNEKSFTKKCESTITYSSIHHNEKSGIYISTYFNAYSGWYQDDNIIIASPLISKNTIYANLFNGIECYTYAKSGSLSSWNNIVRCIPFIQQNTIISNGKNGIETSLTIALNNFQNCVLDANPSITSDIFSNNGEYGISSNNLISISNIKHNNFWENSISNLSGISGGLGTNTRINLNGDSCDVGLNILFNPEFVYIDSFDFHLKSTSKCINAGDLELPWDSDGSYPDIGAFSYLPGTIPTVTTANATDINTISATINGLVNPNGLSTTVIFEYGQSPNYGKSVTAVQSPINREGTNSVSAEITGLIPNATYHFRVVGKNDAGTSVGADQTFTTLKSENTPIATTMTATDIGATSVALNGKVDPNGLSTSVLFEYGSTSSYGDTVAAIQSPLIGSDETPVSVQITGLSSGATFHYRVIAKNSEGTSTGTDETFTTSSSGYPSTLSLMATIDFPSHSDVADYEATDYRIIGLPGASELPVNVIFQSPQKGNWQVYWDNGTEKDYFVKYNKGSDFTFTKGRAFWVIHKGPFTFDVSVPSAPLNLFQGAGISLHSGWNLMTNPFAHTISWSDVQSVNNISEPIWSFEWFFSRSSSFDPYIGYYFFNTDNRDSLVIPYKFSLPKSHNQNLSDESNGWRINISLLSDNYIDNSAALGVCNESKKELDRFDFRRPRSISDVPMVYFHRPDWDANYSNFATDIRPDFDKVESWEFNVFSNNSEKFLLEFLGLEDVPSHFLIYLIDLTKSHYIDLRVQPYQSFKPVGNISKFTVIVGREKFLKEELENIHSPDDFVLGNNYPNPFNAFTTILVEIPVTSEIKLKVYNILGKEVKTIYSGHVESGRYWFEWDGTDNFGNGVASGVYIYRISIQSGLSFSKKLILLN